MSASSFMRKIATIVFPVPGPPSTTLMLDVPASRWWKRPSTISRTATLWSSVRALNGESLNRSWFWIPSMDRVNSPSARRASKTSRNASRYRSRSK